MWEGNLFVMFIYILNIFLDYELRLKRNVMDGWW